MPNWRFLVVRHFCGLNQRRQICAQIRRQVEQRGLSSLLPLVKYELNRQKEYYLGVAVDTYASLDGGEPEEVARRILIDAGISAAASPHSSFLVDAEQVQGLLRGTLECNSFTMPISYEVGDDWKSAPTDQLMSELDVCELRFAKPNATETKQYSRLLYWCSAIGSGGLDQIRQACQALGIESEWGGAWSVLRRLVLLGHLEFDGGAAFRWSVIPPTLVAPVEGNDHRILVGQRTPAIVGYLGERYQVENCPQSNGPPRLRIEGPLFEICYKPDCHAHDAGCVSGQLSELLPAVNDWVLSLPTWDERDLGRFNTEEYQPQTNEFRQVASIAGLPQGGLYRFTFEQPPRRLVTLAYFDDHGDRWICGDYYGLRFLARARCGLCHAIYSVDTHQLVVPEMDRWPMPYERALVLASGALPHRLHVDSGPSVFVYEGISAEFAARMCKLVGLDMEVG
jgi:hypothetical protein